MADPTINSLNINDATRLYYSALSLGLKPEWLNFGNIFTIQTDQGEKYVNWTFSDLNSSAGVTITKNKYVARLVLARHGLPNIPFALPNNLAEAIEFYTTHQDIIAKPIRGFGSTDIHHIVDPSTLSGLAYPKYIFERYTPGREMRYLILRGKIIAVHESRYGDSVKYDRYLERISYPTEQWDPQLSDMALQISKIFGLGLAAVDFMVTPSAEVFVLEVNTAPGLKWFHHPTSGPPIDLATLLLQASLQASDERDTATNHSLRS